MIFNDLLSRMGNVINLREFPGGTSWLGAFAARKI